MSFPIEILLVQWMQRFLLWPRSRNPSTAQFVWKDCSSTSRTCKSLKWIWLIRSSPTYINIHKHRFRDLLVCFVWNLCVWSFLLTYDFLFGLLGKKGTKNICWHIIFMSWCHVAKWGSPHSPLPRTQALQKHVYAAIASRNEDLLGTSSGVPSPMINKNQPSQHFAPKAGDSTRGPSVWKLAAEATTRHNAATRPQGPKALFFGRRKKGWWKLVSWEQLMLSLLLLRGKGVFLIKRLAGVFVFLREEDVYLGNQLRENKKKHHFQKFFDWKKCDLPTIQQSMLTKECQIVFYTSCFLTFIFYGFHWS